VNEKQLTAAADSANRISAIVAMVAVMLIFGFTFIAIKVALREIRPFTLALLRFCIASAILLSLLGFARRAIELRKGLPWGRLGLMGLIGVTVFFPLQNLGLVYTSASEASLILGSIPILTAGLSALFLKERLTLSRAIGVLVSGAGVALVVLESGGGAGRGSLLGNFLILAAALAWSLYTIIGRGVSQQMPHIVVSAFSTLAGTVALVPFAAYECWRYGFGPISSQTWLAVLFLGIVASASTFFLYNYALTRLEAGEAGVYVNLAPIVTVVGGALFLGESLSVCQLLGGAFVLAGVYLAGRRGLS